jgi:predicted MPP superfamily phosphohydrolase
MRILHISDFHLDKMDKEDSKTHIVNPLLNSIAKLQLERPIDLIVFTGDLINIGGKNYSTILEAFKDCEQELFLPILEATKLGKDRIYFVPGNHDIVRNADSKHIDNGLATTLSNSQELNSFFNEPEGISRVLPFKEFEKYFYEGVSNHANYSNFQSTFKIEINGRKIGIACLNSSWRCYDSNKDKNRILIGERQVTDSIEQLKDCEIKIALSHHHYDWLNDFDGEIISTLLKQDFNLYLTGHVHKVKAGYTQDPDGRLFTFCAAGILSASIRNLQNKHENGFTIIDYLIDEAKLRATFKKGEHPKKEFFLNTSIGVEGVWEIKIPVGVEIERILLEQDLIKQIRKEAKPKIDSHLLTHSTDTNAPKDINEIFVMPNIALKEEFDAEKDDKIIENLTDIIVSDKNYILFGTKESGKTILLDKILLESIECNKQCHQIPAIIDFKEFKDNVLKEIRGFWNKTADEAKKLIADYKILLIIDNISFDDDDKYKLKALKLFLEENQNIRFIGSYQQFFDEDFPVNFELVSLLTFDKLTIKQFKSKQIKLLIRKWFPNSDKYDTPKKLETLTNAFLTLNLPRTPFAVSMFLWIIEKQENFKPINNSTLIENFIEKLLKKHDAKESLREKFGYDNKIWIIADLAFKMLKADNENYAITYATFIQYVDEYLRIKKFDDFKTENIVKLLLESGIFIQENGDVRFRFTCFFEFFLVMKMETEPSFKAEVLAEENFLDFVNEIDYYTGLNRGETELLKQINTRLESGFSELNGLIEKTKIERKYENVDGFFTSKDERGKEKPSLVSQLNEKEVINFLPANKPTEDDLEVIEDKKLELQKTEKGIAKKEKGNKIKDLGKLLVLALRVIKNSEEVSEENLKLHSYTIALRNSISFAILHKAVFELFLKNQNKLPKSKVEEFIAMNQFLPLLHELFLFDNIGTLKLTAVIREKIQNDNKENISEFEKALSVFLYSDIRGKDYDKIISEFIKTVKKKFIEDMAFFKLVTYFFYRSKDEDMDNFYLNLIADVLIQSKGYDKNRKGSIIEDYKKKKQEKLTQLRLF